MFTKFYIFVILLVVAGHCSNQFAKNVGEDLNDSMQRRYDVENQLK